VVLDRDPVECPPQQLRELRVLATVLSGDIIHVSDQLAWEIT
jgi:predicted amidohydrolase YtcJ